MKQLARPAALPSLLAALDRALDDGPCALDRDVPSALWRRALSGPAAEFLARPGKELRRAIVRAGWLLGGGDPAGGYERVALAIELIHAGSLIVDDVEDGSLERRGAPALHVSIGMPLAINTGSWMYFWALAELAELDLPPCAHRAAVTTLARCHQGQALDLATRICDLEPFDVRRVVATTTRLKTGGLCRLAAELGAIAAGCDAERRETVAAFGAELGVGLQMADDLGSLTVPARRAKGREDLAGGRPTWPWAWLAESSPFGWLRLADRERAVVAGSAHADALIDDLANAIREPGQAEVRTTLDGALSRLIAVVGAGHVTDEIRHEIAGMEQLCG